MGRRLLSHLLISLAIFSLTVTFFIWVIDSTVLNPVNLTNALRDGGVPSALAKVIPEQATKEEGNQDQQQPNGQPGSTQNNGSDDSQSAEEKADMKAKIASVVTPAFVDEKIQTIATSVIVYMKEGTPKPVIDLSDFPTKLRAQGIEVGDDIDKNFKEPIDITKNNEALSSLPKAYKTFNLIKYAALVLCVLLLVAEYFTAAKGNKMHMIGRIFMHVAFWYTVWWAALIVVPNILLPKLKDKVQSDIPINDLVDAVSKSIQHLVSQYFLAFAIVCWVIALVLYLIRHSRKHIDKIQAVQTVKRGKATNLPNKR